MQLPSVDRQPGARPAGADLVVAHGPKVVPVPPVNPLATAVAAPGVVNNIGDSAARNDNEAVYASVSDPARRGSEAATGSKDWTIRRPDTEKVVEPPLPPISRLLLDFLQSVWRASGGAIEIAQAQNQSLPVNDRNPNATPGLFAKEDLTYTPSKIKKNEKL